jgi:hypothetical protein
MERTPFKDMQGRWITSGLFKETAKGEAQWVLWTLDEAKMLYIACDDPTGYDFATEHLGGWHHWLLLKDSPVLEGIIQQWEEELEAKIRAKAIKRIAKHANTDKGYQAAKYLAEAGWKPKELGRPTKERIESEARIKNKMYSEFGDVVEFKKK